MPAEYRGIESSPNVTRAQLAALLGVRERLGATWAVATTGVAGPDPQDGEAVGTVDLAVAGPDRMICRRLALAGGRADIRASTVTAALRLLRDQVADAAAGDRPVVDDTDRSRRA
jgi:nicotinamide-nucleotide amidase